MTAGLLRDQERIQRKKAQKLAQVKEQEDLYQKQLEFTKKIEEYDKMMKK